MVDQFETQRLEKRCFVVCKMCVFQKFSFAFRPCVECNVTSMNILQWLYSFMPFYDYFQLIRTHESNDLNFIPLYISNSHIYLFYNAFSPLLLINKQFKNSFIHNCVEFFMENILWLFNWLKRLISSSTANAFKNVFSSTNDANAGVRDENFSSKPSVSSEFFRLASTFWESKTEKSLLFSPRFVPLLCLAVAMPNAFIRRRCS